MASTDVAKGRPKTGSKAWHERKENIQVKTKLGEKERGKLDRIGEFYGQKTQTGALRLAVRMTANEKTPSKLPPRIPDESKTREPFTVYLSPDDVEIWDTLQEELELETRTDLIRYAIDRQAKKIARMG